MNNKIISNMSWRLAERIGAHSITFIVSILLARLLEPSLYGSIALITVITTILQVFVDSGLGTALIQKKDADDVDFSSVFYFNFTICIVLYLCLFIASPIIARFYKNNELTPVIRVLGLLLIISGFKNIQNAYVSRNLMFKKYFFATLGGTIAAGIIGIWMAYNGYGIWALVAQNLVNQTIDTIILWVTVRWRPKLLFSWKRLKNLLGYGWKLLVSSLLETVYNQLRQLIIGRKYMSEDLAYYNKGNEFPQYATSAINNSLDSVLFPVVSSVQDNREQVRSITRKSIQLSSFVMWPVMIGLAVTSSSFIPLILTEKWLPAQPYLVIFCISYAFFPIHTANLNAIKALGRSDIFLKLEIIKKVFGIVILFSTIWFGPMVMAYSVIISSLFSQIVNSWPNRKLLDYKYGEQIKDILPSLLLSLFMALCVYPVSFLRLSYFVTLLIQVPLGIIIYIGGAVLFKIESLTYCISVLKGIFKKGKSVNEH